MRIGVSWLDGPATVAFAIVTALSLARLFPLRRQGSVLDFLDAGFHAVMGVVMVAMFLPSTGSTRVWVALLGSTAVWMVLVLAQANRAEPAPAAVSARRRWPLPRIGYYLTSAAIMVIALGSSLGPGRSGSMISMFGMGSTTVLTSETISDSGPSPIGTALVTATSWPIWPFVAVALLLYGGWLTFGAAGHGRSERACTGLMATGMALMAFLL